MHYILNTVFTVPSNTTANRIGGPTVFSKTTSNVVFNKRGLEDGVTYTLIYIKKTETGVEYQFKSLKNNNIVTEVFNSCQEADVFISNMRGEKLPDYNQFYSNIKG